MTYTAATVQEFLQAIAPFDRLSEEAIAALAKKMQLLRYRMGQAIVIREKMPAQVAILYEGRARSLGYDSRTNMPETLELLQSGAVIGWVSLVRGVSCEAAIASSETICLTLDATEFLKLLTQEPAFGQYFQNRCALVEAFELLGSELARRADSTTDLKALTQTAVDQAVMCNLPPGQTPLSQLERDRLWLVSGGTITKVPVGSSATQNLNQNYLEVTGNKSARLIGFPLDLLQTVSAVPASAAEGEIIIPAHTLDIPYAPDEIPELVDETRQRQARRQYACIYGKGPLDSPVACFQMLAQSFNMPFRREVVRRVINEQVRRTGNLSMQFCGAVAEMMGLRAQLVQVPAAQMTRLQTPALIAWEGGYAVLHETSPQELILAVPELGLLRRKPQDFAKTWGEAGQVLMVQPTQETPQKKFGLGWFLPSLWRFRNVLITVFVASFFVQLFSLANPLVIQIIIDKVIVQNSLATLNVLGALLLVLGVFEALLSSLRTYLFVDTTNRIDMALGSEIIGHLLRLPLRYFGRRPVGELSTRINELENIRQFLTGTALTVVLDAVFSLLYVIVLLFYSPLLTAVTMATIPAFVLLTVIVAPIVRRQLRFKAERNAETQSHLVEVMSGIQTVKAQNIELRARWRWQELYSRYVTASFQNVLTSTAAGSMSSFLSKLSALLVLWVGAYLVLEQKLTLGELIAFRIISGYVTTPLLRLAQVWQNFQETGLSLERLADIVDTPEESDETDRDNIPMPPIQGRVRFENLSFRYAQSGPLQLSNINLEIPEGTFVGIVGPSGSGKSTLMKLVPRLYESLSGRIVVDGYDVSKVELYSLRRQIGIVPQETLLFDGTVQENIALTTPDATADDVIEAARIAYAHDFIMGLPNGYNTRVGERGAALSGGQRQRMAIARTLLQNPRILILDEATSALDYQSERIVCTNLAATFQGRTVFFITHRLATIKNADLILMMDQGTVAEQGTHEELMAMRGLYYCLYQQQEIQF
jgi:ATP-binding cassette subfamily B protein